MGSVISHQYWEYKEEKEQSTRDLLDEMGEPVLILDLAKNMLRCAGLPYRPGENVVFTGLRSGEKIHEELSDNAEQSLPTEIDRVSILRSSEEIAFPEELIRALEQKDLEAAIRYVLSLTQIGSSESVTC